ncbi:MAG: hypothetical protein R3Y53_00965 [Bacillota bacterium]
MKVLLYPFIIFGTIVCAKFARLVMCMPFIIIKQKKDNMTEELWAEYFDTINPSKFLLQISMMYTLCLGFSSFVTKTILQKLSFRHATSLGISSFLLGMFLHITRTIQYKDFLIQKLKHINK